MKDNKEVKISFWASHLTTVVSVTLVLILVGVISLIWIGATNETRKLKERIELNAIMNDSIDDARALQVAEILRKKPYVKSVKIISKEEALKIWTTETGENLEDLYGVNPLSPEVSFTLKSEWSDAGKIESIRKQVRSMHEIESVGIPDIGMVEAMNRNITGLTMILGIVAVVMIIISFVLINNTVQLTIYSRRFTIHTMQLVGATNGFIRRPIVLSNMSGGLISGILAVAFIAVLMAFAPHVGLPGVSSVYGWKMFLCVALTLILLGMLLCALAACIAANRYLRKKYEDLFS